MAKDPKAPTLQESIERTGYMQCQIDVADFLLISEKNMLEAILAFEKEMSLEKSGIKRQENKVRLAKLIGEREALKRLWTHVVAMRYVSRDALRN